MSRISLAVLIALVSVTACKKKAAAPDAGAAPPKPVTTTQVQPTPTPVVNKEPVQPGNWREGLKSTDAKVRADAALAVMPSESAAAPPELVAVLGDSDPSVRRAAVKGVLGFILQNADTSAVKKLIELGEKDGAPEVRREAVWALGGLSSKAVVDGLIRMFPGEKDPELRDAMLAALAKHGDRRALSVVVAVLKEKEPPMRAFEAVRRVATRTPVELINLLYSETAAIRRAAAQAIGEIGDRTGVTELMKVAKDKDPEVAAESLAALSLLGGPEPVAVILEQCDSTDPTVQVAAIRALSHYRTQDDVKADDAYPKVLKHAKAGPEQVRRVAIRALAKAKLKRAVPTLKEIAANDKEPVMVRAQALKSMGKIHDAAAALPALQAALADKDLTIVAAAAKGIGRLGKDGAGAAAALMTALKRTDLTPDAKVDTVRAVGRIRAKEAVAALKEIGEKDDVPLARAEAGGALIRIGSADGAAILRPVLTGSKEWEERRAAARLLETRHWKERRAEKLTPEQQAVVTAVTGLISDALKTEKEPLVREVLYRQLSKARGPAAIPAQKAGLEARVPYFRVMAAAGLCQNGEAAGCDAMVTAIDDAEATVRAEAARRAGWYAIQAAVPALQKAVDDPVTFVENAARRALRRIEKAGAAAKP